MGLDRTVFDVSVCAALPECLRALAARRVLLVRDPLATEANRLSPQLEECLHLDSPCGIMDIGATVSPAQVEQFGLQCEQDGYDCIVAVGGGATMDAAKLIAMRASNALALDQLTPTGYAPNRIPIVAVPTTAGSGSEATHFAVLFVDEQKTSVSHPSLQPEWAIVDPSLIATAPQSVAAAAGLDVLCQSIESLWSINSDSKSIAFSTQALQLAAPSLRDAIIDRDSEAQRRLAFASHLAGQAINHTFTTVCHALSYMLTARYNIPHGVAAASTLPAALLLNAGVLTAGDRAAHCSEGTERCIGILKKVFGALDVEAIASELVLLIRAVGGAGSIAELDLPDDYDARLHAQSVDPQRLSNNPTKVTVEDSVNLLRTKFGGDGRVLS